jgi:subtilisin family serine protease
MKMQVLYHNLKSNRMKTIYLSIALLLIAICSKAQEDYYYYKNEKQYLKINTQFIYILCNFPAEEELNNLVAPFGTITYFKEDKYYKRLNKKFSNYDHNLFSNKRNFAEIKFEDSTLTIEAFNEIVMNLKRNSSILNISFHYTTPKNERIAVTNYLWVQVKDSSQIKLLAEKANEIQYSIIGENQYLKNWFFVGANKESKLNPLQASQFFHESNLFLSSEPDVRAKTVSNCVDDTYFNKQWGLKNTGQSIYSGSAIVAGIDTKVCDAWSITTGQQYIDIAIIDQGFENNHPDLDGNIENNGYDAEDGISPTAIYGNHGTACAGIAAAEGNNNAGIAGVARDCDLMSISFDIGAFWTGMSEATDGLMWAVTNGAEIISNSWDYSGFSSMMFGIALDYAFTSGRNNLGCIILFSSGNENDNNVNYPGDTDPRIIVVGALSPCGQRKSPSSCDGENWGSNYDADLDVMAPGVVIATTDRQGSNGYNSNGNGISNFSNNNYTQWFNGTSSACPHAAGIAGLILSVNPCLTYDRVENIMKATCQKVGGYAYSPSFIFPSLLFGSNNLEVGYGLLNADASVRMAREKYLQFYTDFGTTTYKYPSIIAGYNATPFKPNGDYLTTSSANINIQASLYVDLKPGCDLSGVVNVQAVNIGNCDTWSQW